MNIFVIQNLLCSSHKWCDLNTFLKKLSCMTRCIPRVHKMNVKMYLIMCVSVCAWKHEWCAHLYDMINCCLLLYHLWWKKFRTVILMLLIKLEVCGVLIRMQFFWYGRHFFFYFGSAGLDSLNQKVLSLYVEVLVSRLVYLCTWYTVCVSI